MAVEAAGRWAFTTSAYLKLVLKVDATTSEAVLNRLQDDGIIGPKGLNGLCCATRITTQPMQMAAKLAADTPRPTNTPKPESLQRPKVTRQKAISPERAIKDLPAEPTEPTIEPSDQSDTSNEGPEPSLDDANS